MTKDNHIQQGYKPSPLGPIPEDWEVKRLGEICDYVDYRGKSPDKVSNGVFLVTAKNIREGYIDYEISKEYIPKADFEIVMRRGKAEIGDVLITTEAPLGHVAQIDNPNVALAQRVIKYRGKGNMLNTFLKYFLMSETFQTILTANATGSTALGIKGSRLHQLQIIVPSISEQEKIISLLQLWDSAIEKQTALIEKLTLRKKGLMQQLLTGKKRLKGFSGKWKNMRLGEVCPMERGEMLTSDNYINGNVPVIAGGKEPAGYHNCANRTCNTITVSCSGASAGYVAFYKQPIFATDCFTISENDKYNVKYIYYLLLDKQERIYQLQTGGAQPHVHPKDIAPMIINIPSVEEQTAIATVLFDADKEIEIQKQKLTAMQEQKRGLMQMLLTGKKRIKLK